MAKPDLMKEFPHNTEAEQALLGSILIDPSALFRVMPFLKAADFYVIKNGWVYEAALAISKQHKDIDYVVIIDELEKRGRLEEVGGGAYLTKLINAVPSALHIESYARIVKEAAYRRTLLAHASNLAQIAYKEEKDVTAMSMAIGEKLLARKYSLNGKGTIGAAQSLKAQIQEWADNPLSPGEVRGVPTGFRSIDTMLGGLSPSLAICAATTSMGKTAFACQLAVNVAKAGFDVLYFTKEMSTAQVLTRMACAESKISWLDIQAGTLSESDQGRLIKAIDRIDGMPLIISDKCANVIDILATVNGQSNKPSLIVVDYLGLFVPREVDHRSLKLGCAAQSLLALSRQESCTVLALHQIGRKVAERTNKRPQLSDLQWSGMLEQDADIVAFLYREELNTQLANGSPNSKGREMEFIVRKNRLTGRLGTAFLYFGEFAEVRNLNTSRGAAPTEPPPELDIIPWE